MRRHFLSTLQAGSLSAVPTLPTLFLLAIACGDGGGPPPPPDKIFTTLEITPTTAALYDVAPAKTVRLTVVAKDQNGVPMNGADEASFSSANDAVATVDALGTVTGAAPGTAAITASLTIAGITRPAVSTVTVQAAAAAATVAAPAFAYEPATVDVRAGGSVFWAIGSVPHTVTFSTPGAPADIPKSQEGSVSRAFPANGVFQYHCTLHSGMTGTVRVH